MKDQIIKFLAYNGKISVVCCSTTNLVEEARKLHDLSPLSTAAMGRVLTITALIGSEMKNKTDKLTIQIKGNGPIGKIVAVSDNIPNVKACITNPHADLPLNEFGKLDVGGAVGNQGFINVIKDIGLKEPYIGISPLTSGEIAEDFANYFETSEQKQTAVALGVLVDKNGVRASGGYIISPMPDATDEEIKAACQKASVHEFIMTLPQGYDTQVGELGDTLSGGERQRISIARALLKDSPIILLDEATASLDADNETLIQQAISRLIKDKTVIIIAHRMRTVSGADKIVVLEDGIVTVSYTHLTLPTIA